MTLPIIEFPVFGQNGELLTALNASLMKRQKVTPKQIEALKTSHQLRWLIFQAAEKIIKGKELGWIEKLKMLAGTFEALELQQQELWNFTVNKNYCRFWDFPGCGCPKMDNNERWGTSHTIMSSGCPIHSGKVEEYFNLNGSQRLNASLTPGA